MIFSFSFWFESASIKFNICSIHYVFKRTKSQKQIVDGKETFERNKEEMSTKVSLFLKIKLDNKKSQN